jgi:hypothetical protein
MLHWRTVMLLRSGEEIPTACEPSPAASPPSLKPLQSMVTLLVLTEIALPDWMDVDRSLRSHHTPWVVMVAGTESMKPVQLS